jgi:hypothetical protein
MGTGVEGAPLSRLGSGPRPRRRPQAFPERGGFQDFRSILGPPPRLHRPEFTDHFRRVLQSVKPTDQFSDAAAALRRRVAVEPLRQGGRASSWRAARLIPLQPLLTGRYGRTGQRRDVRLLGNARDVKEGEWRAGAVTGARFHITRMAPPVPYRDGGSTTCRLTDDRFILNFGGSSRTNGNG